MNSSETITALERSNGYSAAVSLTLLRDGQSLEVAQVGGGTIYFSERVALAPGIWTLIRCIDGNVRKWDVEVTGNGDASDCAEFRFL